MDPGTIGLIGGIVGSAIGVSGGVVGTYFSIKSTKTAAERRFVVKCALGVWVAGTLLIGLPLVLWFVGLIPYWFYLATYILFYILLLPAIFWAEKAMRAKKRNL